MNDGGTATRISPEGVQGIERAASLRISLLEAFEKGASVELDLTKVEDLDLSCVQLLYAARREARARSLSFRLVGALSKRVGRRLQGSGFTASLAETGPELEAGLAGWSSEES